jgi:hypothetical protein
VGRALEGTVELITPGVIGAAQVALHIAGLIDQLQTPMAANVVEGAQGAGMRSRTSTIGIPATSVGYTSPGLGTSDPDQRKPSTD